MAIANLFGRGVGFGPPHWIVTRGYESGTAVVSTKALSPTRLAFALTANDLAFSGIVPTQLAFDLGTTLLTFYGDDGIEMATPLTFTAGETGTVTLTLTGADGTAENLTGASSVTFTLMNLNGTVYANAVSLTVVTAASGTVTWNRLSAQIGVAGDYLGQAKVVRADATIGYFPDARGTQDGYSGAPIVLLRAVGT